MAIAPEMMTGGSLWLPPENSISFREDYRKNGSWLPFDEFAALLPASSDA